MAITTLQSKSARWLFAELAVVVLGILIAFQIEEWRTTRSNDALIKSSLEAMIADLDDDRRQLELFDGAVSSQIIAITELLDLLILSQEKEEHWIADRYRASLIYRTWVPNEPTYTALVDSGNVHLITDIELQNAMYQYSQYTTYLTRRLARYFSFREQLLETSLRDIFRLPNIQNPTNFATDPIYMVKPIEDFPRHPDFLGALAELGRDTTSLPDRFRIAMERNTELKNEIERYLRLL